MILIDQARWWYRERRWCHLVSDRDLEELHTFAAANGIPERGFQGDHYDVPEEYRGALIAAGAVEVTSVELVRRLRAAGLRLTPAERRRRSACWAESASAITVSR
ncbi:MAG: DUF4031 domain-containing protein [Acidimicrobiia bacterium]|nr:DUF4031 domain-containing protein [Acidimicrobiia bacterium]